MRATWADIAEPPNPHCLTSITPQQFVQSHRMRDGHSFDDRDFGALARMGALISSTVALEECRCAFSSMP